MGEREGGTRGRGIPSMWMRNVVIACLPLQQGFYADEVAAGAGHTTTAMLLHDLRLVSTVCICRLPVAIKLDHHSFPVCVVFCAFCLYTTH